MNRSESNRALALARGERTRAQIQDLWDMGVTDTADVALRLGISKRQVQRQAARIPGHEPKPGVNTPHPPEVRSRALELLADKCSYHEVGRTLGVDPKTVSRWFPGRGMSASEAGRLAAAMRKHQKVLD